MEGLARLVSESMARHGVDCSLDYRRLPWSRWFRIETTFDLVWVPAKPGLFALAEELIAPGDTTVAGGKRMLAVLEIRASDDLAIAMSRLFAPGNPLKERLAEGRIFSRYVIIADDSQRRAAFTAFQQWFKTSAEIASGVMSDIESGVINNSADFTAFPPTATDTELKPRSATVHSPAPLPSGF